jgi:predicted kinase
MLYLIVGPPASGKSTWVKQHAQPGDITVDYDAIASVLTPPGGDPHDQPAHIKTVTKAARRAAIDQAVALSHTIDVYVIHSSPSARLLDHYRTQGAELIVIDPGYSTVMERCKRERPWRMQQAVKEWYADRDRYSTARTEGATAMQW